MKWLAVCVLVLSFVGFGEAACAWVLWTETWTERDPTRTWSYISAHTTQAECRASLNRMYEDEARKPGTTIRDAIVIRRQGSPVQATLDCLPDTIDPRGPAKK